MLYKFKSKAAADVIMTAPVAEKVLSAMHRSAADQGILQASDLPALVSALEAAIAQDEALRDGHEAGPHDANADDDAAASVDAVALKQRAWPLLDMMKRSIAEGAHVTWGA